MANEAKVLKEKDDYITYFAVSNATAIAKGTLMIFHPTTTRLALKHDGTKGQKPVGFTVSEKEASDGQTYIGIQRRGIVTAIAAGTIAMGDIVFPSVTANRVEAATALATSILAFAEVVGIALNAATVGTTVDVRLWG